MKKQKVQFSLKRSLILITCLGIFLIVFMSIANYKNVNNYNYLSGKQQNNVNTSNLVNSNVIQEDGLVTFSGLEKTIFTDDIFAYIFGYPSDQLSVVEYIPSPGYSVTTVLSLNKFPRSDVIKLSAFSSDLLKVDPELNGQLYIENYNNQDGKYKVEYLTKSYEVKPSKVIDSDFGEIIVISGIEIGNDNLKFSENLGYLALMKSGNENYLPINIIANKELISYEEFVSFLETIKKASFQFSQDSCPAPEITSWGEGMALRNTFLKLCGRKTAYPAVLFQDQGYILFNQGDIIKTINIQKPFREEVLIEGVKVLDIESTDRVSDDFYTAQTIADGPGSLSRIFTFQPSTKKFIYVNNSIFNGRTSINFASSYSDKAFSANITTGCSMGSCEVYDAMLDSDIQTYANGKSYTKKQVKENVDNLKTLISCADSFDLSKIHNYPPGSIIDTENFPPKIINCLDYDNKTALGGPSIKGYFDLEQSKFVVTK